MRFEQTTLCVVIVVGSILVLANEHFYVHTCGVSFRLRHKWAGFGSSVTFGCHMGGTYVGMAGCTLHFRVPRVCKEFCWFAQTHMWGHKRMYMHTRAHAHVLSLSLSLLSLSLFSLSLSFSLCPLPLRICSSLRFLREHARGKPHTHKFKHAQNTHKFKYAQNTHRHTQTHTHRHTHSHFDTDTHQHVLTHSKNTHADTNAWFCFTFIVVVLVCELKFASSRIFCYCI